MTGDSLHGSQIIEMLLAYRLRVEVQQKTSGLWFSAEYSSFRVANEAHSYTLYVGGYSGDAGDSLNYHNGMKFSTWDVDNDGAGDCATSRGGGMWFNGCENACLPCSSAHHVWYHLPNSYLLINSRIMIRQQP